MTFNRNNVSLTQINNFTLCFVKYFHKMFVIFFIILFLFSNVALIKKIISNYVIYEWRSPGRSRIIPRYKALK